MVSLLFAIAAILFIVWLLGWTAFAITGPLWHIVLVLAVIVLVYNLVTRNRVV